MRESADCYRKKLVRNAILDYVEMYMDMEMSMGQQFM